MTPQLVSETRIAGMHLSAAAGDCVEEDGAQGWELGGEEGEWGEGGKLFRLHLR